MLRLVFSSRENPEEGSDANEGTNLPVQVTASKQRVNASFLHALTEAASRKCGQVKGGCAHLKRSGLKVGLPALKDLIRKKKSFAGVPSLLDFLLIPDAVKLTTKNSHHKSTPCELDTQPYLLMACIISK